MIGQRRGLLSYLKSIDIERYRSLIERLGTQKIIVNKERSFYIPLFFLLYGRTFSGNH